MYPVTLITGGARSGKSRYALDLAKGVEKKSFIATATPSDDEMQKRIARHREERSHAFRTVEAPVDLAGAIQSIRSSTEVAVVDCLTVWLGNLTHRHGISENSYPEVGALLKILEAPPLELIIVSNELGMGLVPATEVGRHFRDLAGQVNQAVAQRADRVFFMVSGIPLITKERKR